MTRRLAARAHDGTTRSGTEGKCVHKSAAIVGSLVARADPEHTENSLGHLLGLKALGLQGRCVM